MVNGEYCDIKLKWLYAPNSLQLDELLEKYLSTLNIREYKADIFNLINQFVDYGMEKVSSLLTFKRTQPYHFQKTHGRSKQTARPI